MVEVMAAEPPKSEGPLDRCLAALGRLVPLRFRSGVAVVPVVRLAGTIGFSTPLKPGLTLGHLADSYLYLGPRSSLTKSTVNPAIYRGDEQYLSYLQRRESLGPYFRVDSLLTEGDPRFFPD